MGRPAKTGLDYFPKDVDFYDDFKIMDLLNEYGPSGICVYEVILCMVYQNGYFIEVAQDKLALAVVRCIGGKWIKKDFVLQVILYCADIGLFDHDLLRQGVITSAGIQKRYALVTVRNKVHKDKFWLLEKDLESKVVFSDAKNTVSDTEKGVSVTETQVSEAEMLQSKVKESKEKKINSSRLLNSNQTDSTEEVLQNPNSLPTTTENLFNIFEEEFGRPLSQREMQTISEWVQKLDSKLILYALKEASIYRRMSIEYIQRILQSWTSKGFTPEDIESGEHLYKNNRR